MRLGEESLKVEEKFMAKVEKETWSIDQITCSRWMHPGDRALVIASNYAGDSLDFEVARHPDGYTIAYSIDADFKSEDIFEFESEKIINENLIDAIDERLEDWQKQVSDLSKKLYGVDMAGLGIAIDDSFYATLAKLYEVRAEMREKAITERLASDMGVSISTAKERLRRARSLGFLTSPGKGGAGQGEATKKANNHIIKVKKGK